VADNNLKIWLEINQQLVRHSFIRWPLKWYLNLNISSCFQKQQCLNNTSHNSEFNSEKVSPHAQNLRDSSHSSNFNTSAFMNEKVRSKVNALKTRIHRIRPSSKALKEMRYYQKTTESLIPKLSFQRLVRRIALSIGNDFRYQFTALDALQETCETFLVGLFGKHENKKLKF
jgi:histone H3/H4